MCLVGTLRVRLSASDWELLCEGLGAKFPGKKRMTLGKGLLLALVGDFNEIALTLLEKDLEKSCKWKRSGNIRNRVK